MPSVTAWTDKFQQGAGRLDDGIDGLVGRVHRAGAHGGLGVSRPIRAAQADGGGGHAHRPAGNLQADPA